MLLDEKNLKESSDIEPISQDMLRKYIIYARRYTHPKLSEINEELVKQFYAKIRKESQIAGGLTITVRHIESLLRMSEAHARMNLREFVR